MKLSTRDLQAGLGFRVASGSSRVLDGIGIPILGGSWVVIGGVISKVTIVITHIRGLVTIPYDYQ